MADTGSNYKRPSEGFRFKFGGMKTNSVADSLPPDKYAFAQNIRALRDSSIRTRWGLTPLFPTTGSPVTDINSYAALGTDNLPRFLARDANDSVWLGQPANTSAPVGTLFGGGASPGASMIPFRPAQSPVPWMYVANGADYEKFSAPGVADAVTQQEVGIAEPQAAPDAALGGANNLIYVFSSNPAYAHTGVATAAVNQTRVTDTVQSVFSDPAYTNLLTLGVSTSQNYTRQMLITISGGLVTVQDVYPQQANAIGIAGIYYYSGVIGRCVVVPKGLAGGPGTEGQSLYTQDYLASIRRGSLVKFSGGGTETCIVWSVTEGPDGTICFETSTVNHHSSAETFTQPPAVQVLAGAVPAVGAAVSAQTVGFNLSGAGIGKQTSTAALVSPFVSTLYSFQSEDYFHISVAFVTLASLNEFKVLLDVGDGTFTSNFYYYTVRVSDIQAAVNNTLTQLGAAQLVTQRAIIDAEQATAARNQGTTQSGDQMTPGDGMWADIVFPISSFTRVGTDTTKSLQTVNAIQFLFNMNAATDCSIGWNSIFGGGQPDVGPSGAPYLYRVRPRSSVTGVKGNPSPAMRYSVNPRRSPVTVYLPSAAYDPQIDTWDIFRYGGTVTSWRKIGQTASTNTSFLDNYSDYAALAGEELEFDNLQPWPTIDVPLNAGSANVIGTTAIAVVPSPNNVLRYLPGNEVRIGSVNVYTLRARPTLLGFANYLFQFIENAGVQSSVTLSIYEPAVADQSLPYMWGPDAAGTVFACGDPLRPGTLSFAKNYAPDAVPDSYNIEITNPSEPLLGGEVLDGLSFVASSERWWALYPQPSNPLQRYSVIQQPITRGLAAPFGHCNDGRSLYWWAKDSIQSSEAGSLTDADLSNIFPHDGVPGVNHTYNGNTVYAPDYSRAGTFRLTCCNNHLYATYQDSTGTPRCLVLDLKRMAWSVDSYANSPATVFHAPAQQEGTVLTETTAYPLLVSGAQNGNVYQQTDLHNDDTTLIGSIVCTMEWDGGDTRAGEQWGDLWLDCAPNAKGGSSGGITVTPLAFGAIPAGVSSTIIPSATTRVQSPISLGGEVLTDFLGMQVQWSDDYSQQSAATSLQIWQPSYIHKPETINDRFTDWYDGGTEAAKFVQGFLLHCDTFNTIKGLAAFDSDTLTLHPFTPAVIHNGESIHAYSFVAPFIAHQVRLQPIDQQPWRFFDVDWIWEPTPEVAETWQTQATSFGFNGYSHIQRIVAAYAASASVTLTITAFDGTSPAVITLPATGGAYQKLLRVLTFNKGQLYTFAASSSAPFQIYVDDFEVLVGGWGRGGPYLTWKALGSPHGVLAKV